MNKSILYVERLTLAGFLFSVFPLLARRNFKQVFVVDANPFLLRLATLAALACGTKLEKLLFHLVDVRDDQGLLIRLKIEFFSLGDVQERIFRCHFSEKIFQEESLFPEFQKFIHKNLATISLTDPRTIWRALLLIEVVAWQAREKKIDVRHVELLLEKRRWMHAIKEYGTERGLLVRFLCHANAGSIKERAKENRIVRNIFKKISWTLGNKSSAKLPMQGKEPVIALECYDYFNLDKPEFYSDFFFWQQSELSGKNIIVLFNVLNNPLDSSKMTLLKEHQMQGIALNSKVAKAPNSLYCPSKKHGKKIESSILSDFFGTRMEKRWIRGLLHHYNEQYAYWKDLFLDNNIKAYVTWFRYDASHCVIADAIRDAGGVLAIYQRALDSKPSVSLSLQSDIAFGFSAFSAELEKQAFSKIPYYVVTGYFGDHRYPLLISKAASLRAQMEKRGAKRIVSYTDEGSGDDPRWHTGHIYVRQNYTFLLEKVLSEPWFGLVLKPKVPSSLRRRLGPVAELLKRAEETGRCYVYETGVTHGNSPPSIAALSADVAIHGYLCAPTAGFECALAGVPTLLMDREGWSISPLYRLGVGKVVFNDWKSLWSSCLEHWNSPKGIPGFGNWSFLLPELDPFRDGKGAYRMGTYIQWLIEGFKANLPRETVLADAAERYCKQWGSDKIESIGI